MGLVLVGCSFGGAATPVPDFTPGAPAAATPIIVPTDSTQIAATVNGQPITMDAFNREMARYKAGLVALGFQVSDEASDEQQVLDLLVEEELIRQEGARQGVTVSDDEVNQEINGMIAEDGQDYFDGWLQSNYYTLDEFREVIRLNLLTNKLLEPVVAAVPTSAEQVHARHILVNTQDEATAILTRLQAGEDFAALAQQNSVDVTTRDSGGDLGWFPRGGLLVPEVEDVAFSQQPGQVSGVVQSAWGFHIVETLEFDPNRAIDFDTQQRLKQKAVEQWSQGLRAGADVQQLVSFTSP